MGLTTFGIAKTWVEPGYGDCNGAVTGEVVNAIREHFFAWYVEVRLFLDVIECFRVHRYCMDCDACRDSYLGITLPNQAINIEAMWLNDWPVRIHNSWREYQTGLTPECECNVRAIEMPGAFCTFADIAPGAPIELYAVATSSSDWGKRLVITGKDVAMADRRETLVLASEPVRTEFAFRSINHRGGILKDITAGRIRLMDADGNTYGIYEPHETVPSYRRQKITGVGVDCSNVNVRSARRFVPLFGDDEVVETDNRMAFDAMARYLRNYRKVEKTRETLVSEKNDLATARQMIIGSKAREEGGATQVDVAIASPVFRGRTLNRFG